MKKWILFLCLLVTLPCFAQKYWAVDQSGNPLVDYTGGTAGCLDAIDGTKLSDGDIAIVTKDVGNYIVTSEHRLNASSEATASGIAVILPATNPGTKRWECVRFPYAFGTVEPTDDLGGELEWHVKP